MKLNIEGVWKNHPSRKYLTKIRKLEIRNKN